MFLTDDQTLQQVSDAQAMAGIPNLAGSWAGINRRAHARAYNELVAALTARGYSAAQIAGWDRGAEVEGDLTVFYAMVLGAGQMSSEERRMSSVFTQTYDRRRELAEIAVTVGGVYQSPAGPQGIVGAGGPSVGPGDLWSGARNEPGHGRDGDGLFDSSGGLL